MMKYKVGDKVKIRKDLEMGQIYGGCLFTKGMQNLCGKIARITEVCKSYGNYRYCIASSNLYWTDEMFEGVDMEAQKMNKHVVIYVDGNKVVARCGDKEGVARCDKKGIARCHPDDDFDFYVGAKLALERLEEADKPYGWLKEGMIYYIPEMRYERLYNDCRYEADCMDKMYMDRGIVFKTKEEAIACARKMLEVVKKDG